MHFLKLPLIIMIVVVTRRIPDRGKGDSSTVRYKHVFLTTPFWGLEGHFSWEVFIGKLIFLVGVWSSYFVGL